MRRRAFTVCSRLSVERVVRMLPVLRSDDGSIAHIDRVTIEADYTLLMRRDTLEPDFLSYRQEKQNPKPYRCVDMEVREKDS